MNEFNVLIQCGQNKKDLVATFQYYACRNKQEILSNTKTIIITNKNNNNIFAARTDLHLTSS